MRVVRGIFLTFRAILLTITLLKMMRLSSAGRRNSAFTFRHTQQRRYSETRLFSSSNRQDLLQKSLTLLGIDPETLDQAATQSINTPTNGYDGRYGKSAIKAYRSFISSKATIDTDKLQAAAQRAAHQIDFLRKRHDAHKDDWIRHSDDTTNINTTNRTTFPLVLLLDNIRSAHNVGSLFRTSDAAGVASVLTTGITPHPMGAGSDKIAKAALGAERIVPSLHFNTAHDAINHVREQYGGYRIIGMETTEQSVTYTDFDFVAANVGVCLVLGNEVTGVPSDVLRLMDAIVEIPMFGAKNSLNVAACAPVVLYEILRQWNK
jgi:23S rRNA (guanosine2251-2'-O)-methyltransferase